jgi:hypothetical protein
MGVLQNLEPFNDGSVGNRDSCDRFDGDRKRRKWRWRPWASIGKSIKAQLFHEYTQDAGQGHLG